MFDRRGKLDTTKLLITRETELERQRDENVRSIIVQKN